MQKIDLNKRAAFIKKANDGSIPEKKIKAPQLQLKFTFSQGQKEFIDEITLKTGQNLSQLVWQSVIFAKNKPLDTDMLKEYWGFINERNVFDRAIIKNQGTLEMDLKACVEAYKEQGFKVKIKGVTLLYLLNYMNKHYDIDISKYHFLNFTPQS